MLNIQTRSSESCSSFTCQFSFTVRGSFFKSACFFASFVLLMQISTELMHTLSYLITVWSARARHPFLKQLNEDSNFKLHMYAVSMHEKGASGVPRTHHTACNISKFSGGMPQTPPSTIYMHNQHPGPVDPVSQFSKDPWVCSLNKMACMLHACCMHPARHFRH